MTLIHAERSGVNLAEIAPFHCNVTTHKTFIKEIEKVEILLYSAGKKKRTAQKGYFGAQKNYLFIIFFFSCLKMVFFELMLLDFSDLLGSFLLRNFFIAARSIFSCKYFSCFIQYIWRFRNQLKICLGGWLGRWHGRIDNKAISAFK